jgi:hypothetical protein
MQPAYAYGMVVGLREQRGVLRNMQPLHVCDMVDRLRVVCEYDALIA